MKIMLFDTHAHLNFAAYKDDRNEVIKRALDNNVWLINVGSKYETSKRAVEIAQNYEQGVWAAVGLHPIHLETQLVKIKVDPEEIQQFQTAEEEFNYQKYKELAGSEKVVAIGEIGLDYYYKPKTKRKLELFKEKQKEVFEVQLKLARELNLPVIFHCRMAHDDLLKILKEQRVKNKERLKGVIHCFTGKWKQAEEYLEMGFYIGFNGIIFKNIEGIDFQENIRKIPLDRILIETDCPYLTPLPKTGRNEPLYIKYVAKKIAELKEVSFEEVARVTTENARKLFRI